ncbi:MAG: hypothetical protein U0641_15375 [Anaerolineae bacterium]
MKGIQYVTDEAGHRTAVIISLAEWGDIWEDIYDIIVSESRKGEPTMSWDDLKAEMDRDEANGGTLPR